MGFSVGGGGGGGGGGGFLLGAVVTNVANGGNDKWFSAKGILRAIGQKKKKKKIIQPFTYRIRLYAVSK